MNTETLIELLSTEDLRGIFRFMNEESSGTPGDLKRKVRKKSETISWKYLLMGVSKESLQRICGVNGLRSDLSKDELVNQIVMSFPKPPAKKGLLRDLFGPWQRWTSPGQRGRSR